MFQLLPKNLNIPFVGPKAHFIWVSVIAMIASVVIIFTVSPNYGIDFRGGSDIVLDFENDVPVDQVRQAAKDAGFPDANVQTYGTGEHLQYLVQTREVSVVNANVIKQIQAKLAENSNLITADWDPTHPDRLEIVYSSDVDNNIIANAIESVGIQGSQITKNKGTQDDKIAYTVKFEELSQKVRDGFKQAMGPAFNAESGIVRLETVGPRAGEQLRNSAMLSVIATLIMLLIYISVRFDFRYAPGAIIALVHDVLICWAFLIISRIEISLTTVAAMLTIIGYSLNDTIIIYDRIRENLVKEGNADIVSVVNTSANETLSRTVITSFTTLLAVLSLSIFTTGSIQDFAITLLVGIVAGTLSTLFLASPVMVYLDEYIKTRRKSMAIAESMEEENHK